MTQSELEVALRAAFNQCAAALHPLSDRQKQILLQAVLEAMPFDRDSINQRIDQMAAASSGAVGVNNPLKELTTDEQQAFLSFLKQQESQNKLWKMTLLNDWLEGRSSGAVQFIRERYGIQWLEQITPEQVANYLGPESRNQLGLKVGDRIEVTNGLWEWVQETGPCSREWYRCTVIDVQNITETNDAESPSNGAATSGSNGISCIIRFEDGTEYEMQGIYDWNRPNWRWLEA